MKRKAKLKTLFGILASLDWIKILKVAIDSRPSSWADTPVIEWRNASDTVFSAIMTQIREKYKEPIDIEVDFAAMTDKKSPYKRGTKYVNLIKFDQNGYPCCEKHGAMNCVNKERSLWRCLQCGVGISFDDALVCDEWCRLWTKRTQLGIPRRGYEHAEER